MAIVNQFKTLVLLSALTALLMWFGSLFGRIGLIIGLLIAISINVGSYWFSDKLVLKMYKAKEINSNEIDPRLKQKKDEKELTQKEIWKNKYAKNYSSIK